MTSLPDGYMRDAKGALIPIGTIKPEHLLEDELVRDLLAEAEVISGMLTAFREAALERVASFRALIDQQYGVTKGGRKGNVTLTSFDGTLQMQVAIGEHLAFGPELQAAKALIDQCVERWSEGANENIRALVDHAFQVNKQGRIDTHRVLGLRRLSIEDPDWQRAMDAIGDAVRVVGSKTYARFYRVDPVSGVRTAIPLDLANA